MGRPTAAPREAICTWNYLDPHRTTTYRDTDSSGLPPKTEIGLETPAINADIENPPGDGSGYRA